MTIQDIMSKEQIPYCVIVNNTLKCKICLGDKNKVFPDDLIRMIENNETLSNLIQSLEKQMLPAHWGQGKIEMLASVPREKIVVLLFYYANDDVIFEYRRGKKIDTDLKGLDYEKIFNKEEIS